MGEASSFATAGDGGRLEELCGIVLIHVQHHSTYAQEQPMVRPGLFGLFCRCERASCFGEAPLQASIPLPCSWEGYERHRASDFLTN